MQFNHTKVILNQWIIICVQVYRANNKQRNHGPRTSEEETHRRKDSWVLFLRNKFISLRRPKIVNCRKFLSCQ